LEWDRNFCDPARRLLARDNQGSLVRGIARLFTLASLARSTFNARAPAISACSTFSRREISSDIILKSTSSEIARASLDASSDLADHNGGRVLGRLT
jgi:hypothetical protein